MELDSSQCYIALRSRDPRFDGRFFTAVLTTGVYCRPICPAVTPQLKNVRFYPSAAAAREAGFRPCLRCRPEASPAIPEWQDSSSLVSRGLRMIWEGRLDEAGVEGLAASLNVGARHLRRLFTKNLGASPNAIAQTRRLDFARRLIDETSLPFTEIAFSAGYSSLRRFNATILQTYGSSPTKLRRKRIAGLIQANDNFLVLKLFYRPPFDWLALRGFLQARAIPGVEEVGERYYRRTVRMQDSAGVIEIKPVTDERHLLLVIPANFSRDLLAITERVRNLFDLRTDSIVIDEQLGRDPILGPLARANPGLRVPGAWDGFEIAVRAILGQQVSVNTASTMAGRLVEAYGERLQQGNSPGLKSIFPTPDRLSRVDLTNIGLTRQRAMCIQELARAVEDGRLTFKTGASLDQSIESLTEIPGIGAWTAHYIAMRALHEPDAFPSGDLGLRRVYSHLSNGAPNEKELIRYSEAWKPWRAYAAMHLWSYDGKIPG